MEESLASKEAMKMIDDCVFGFQAQDLEDLSLAGLLRGGGSFNEPNDRREQEAKYNIYDGFLL